MPIFASLVFINLKTFVSVIKSTLQSLARVYTHNLNKYVSLAWGVGTQVDTGVDATTPWVFRK